MVLADWQSLIGFLSIASGSKLATPPIDDPPVQAVLVKLPSVWAKVMMLKEGALVPVFRTWL